MKQYLAGAFLIILVLLSGHAYCEESGAVEEKLYNFDDMLIDGAFRDPQGMFERARAEAKFEGVLRLERSYMQRLEEDAQESSMRP
ncbi:MAG: hypothetical protein II767_11375 [Proteobacteria bacterium]|nr:hypothetical protein [Pseudomonadota bacterium]MBQ4360844.1 hypothetical protein [Pseudomonadota bacterium]